MQSTQSLTVHKIAQTLMSYSGPDAGANLLSALYAINIFSIENKLDNYEKKQCSDLPAKLTAITNAFDEVNLYLEESSNGLKGLNAKMDGKNINFNKADNSEKLLREKQTLESNILALEKPLEYYTASLPLINDLKQQLKKEPESNWLQYLGSFVSSKETVEKQKST